MWRRAEADRIRVVVVVRLALAGNVFAIAWDVQRLVRCTCAGAGPMEAKMHWRAVALNMDVAV